MLWIEAGAGLGKTSLIQVATDWAHRAGVRVLAAPGVQLEQQLGFGVVRRLFSPLVTSLDPQARDQLFSGAAGLAAPVLFDDPAGPVPMDAMFSRFHGLHWLTVDLAQDGPVLLVVDDAQWADEASISWLNYLANRLEATAVGVLVAARPGEVGGDQALVQLREAGDQLRLEPLSASAVAQWLDRDLGAPVDSGFAAACHEASGGSPFLLSELVGELRRRGITPIAEHAALVGTVAPEGIARSVLTRIAALPVPAGALARALAVLDDGAALRPAALLAELDPGEAAAGASALTAAEIIAPGRELTFSHPLLRSAVQSSIDPWDLAGMHARAARILHEDGAAADKVALHLLDTEPADDAWVVEILHGAASQVLSRGASGTAAVLLTRALREPPTRQQRFVVLRDLGDAQARLGNPAAVDHWQAALADTAADPRASTELVMRFAWLLTVRGGIDHAEAMLRGVVADRKDHDPIQAALAAVMVYYLCVAEPHPAAQVTAARRVAGQLATSGPPAQTLGLLDSWVSVIDAHGGAAAGPAFQAALSSPLLSAPTADPDVKILVAAGLAYAGALEEADQALEAMLRGARAAGSLFWTSAVSCYRAMLDLKRGRYADAVAAGRLAMELYEQFNVSNRSPQPAAYLMDALLARGQVSAAGEVSAAFDDVAEPEGAVLAAFLAARSRVRLAQGQPTDAETDALRAGEVLTAMRATNPGFMQWRSSLALALAANGRDEDARHWAAEEVQLGRASRVPEGWGRALRIHAHVGDPDHAVDRLTQAVDVLHGSGADGELAHAHIDLGTAHRRAGDRTSAREHLTAGLDLAMRCGADTLAETAVQELRATGARPRRRRATGIGALTPSELRVARLAADGLTNRDIAQALFITTKTVEDHLHATYRKLAIESRTQLFPALER